MRLRPFILPVMLGWRRREDGRCADYTARGSISGSIDKGGYAAFEIAFPISRLSVYVGQAAGTQGCLGEGLLAGLPDPQAIEGIRAR
jgi:hypothetical protein